MVVYIRSESRTYCFGSQSYRHHHHHHRHPMRCRSNAVSIEWEQEHDANASPNDDEDADTVDNGLTCFCSTSCIMRMRSISEKLEKSMVCTLCAGLW